MRTRWLLRIRHYITSIKSVFRTKILFSIGGLGNQLFVFNFAHKLIELGATKVVIFNCWHNDNIDRAFQLELIKSKCSHKISFSDNLFVYKVYRLSIRAVTKINLNFILPKKLQIYVEGITSNCNNFEKYKIFSGYFQDTSFFPETSLFLDEFGATVTDAYKETSSTLMAEFADPFQAVHIRRGDYISHRDTFGVLAINYFSNQLISNIPLLVLSEEALNYAFIKDSRSLLKVPDYLTPWQLMSVLCQATFLAGSNSTFSFWPAFYVTAQGRKASIPTPWFRNHPEYMPRLNCKGLICYPALWE
jgi:hypothetical protein